MINVQDQLKTQLKIAARKQHYFAISSMLSSQLDLASKIARAGQELGKARESDPEGVPLDLLKTSALELFHSLSPIYQICVSLRAYKQAFGEYPEWTRFIKDGEMTERKLEEMIHEAIRLFEDASRTLGKVKNKTILDYVFGESFLEVCEKVKVRGE